ncbi:MAG: tetratricopeptide repeat protein [Thermoplasmatota archaeon]
MRSDGSRLPDSFNISGSSPVKFSGEMEEGKCIMCGSETPGRSMCGKCLSGYPRDDLGQINILFMIVTFGIAASLLIAYSSKILGSYYSDTMDRISWIGPVLLVLSLLGAGSIVFQARKKLLGREPLTYLAYIIGTLLAAASISYLLNAGPDPLGITLGVIILMIGTASAAGSMFSFKKLGTAHMALPLLGYLPSFTGFTRVIAGKPDIINYWLLHNDTLIVMGMALTFLIILLSINSSSLWSKILMPTIIWTSGIVIASLSLGAFMILGSGSFIEMSIYSGFMLVTAGMGSLISWRYLNLRMNRELIEVCRAITMAEVMYRSGKNYYALQHIDRALHLNPLSGMGMDRRTDNIIFKVDRGRSLRSIIFEPGEYELAYNEKGKILTSQGKYPEAVKAYMEGIRRCPEYPESYINLAMLLYSTPGKKAEGSKHFNYYVTSKGVFLRRWLKGDLTSFYAVWMTDNFDHFRRSLALKGKILSKLGEDGDLLGYYSMMKGM